MTSNAQCGLSWKEGKYYVLTLLPGYDLNNTKRKYRDSFDKWDALCFNILHKSIRWQVHKLTSLLNNWCPIKRL